jgi:hypothetical protein
MIRYKYDGSLTPPAPFVNVTLRNYATGARIEDFPAQVDPGADRTVLPEAVVKALELPQTDVLMIAGLGGLARHLPAYIVHVSVHTYPGKLVKIVATSGEAWAILGRDTLNSYRILLDGPHLALEIE